MNPKTLALTGSNCEVCGKPMVIDSQSQGKALTWLVCPNGHQLLIDSSGLEVK